MKHEHIRVVAREATADVCEPDLSLERNPIDLIVSSLIGTVTLPNIAVVVLDTLRKDSFDEYFDWLPGHRFENAHSPSHYTIPVHASLFSGKYASEVGVHAKSETLDCPDPVLAEQLREAGYTTRAYSENFLLSPLNDFNRGFDDFVRLGRSARGDTEVFDWIEAIESIRGTGILRDLRAILRCFRDDCSTLRSLRYGWQLKRGRFDGAQELLDHIQRCEFEDSEFLFANLMETHLPYDPPESYKTVQNVDYALDDAETVLGGDLDHTNEAERYSNCVKYLSDVYRDVFAELRDQFDIIITLSDHGELFGEHGATRHWHGVYPELAHVPLVVWNGGDTVETHKEPVSLLDVHQTVLSAANVDAESRGQDLLNDPKGRPCLVEYHGLRKHRIDLLTDRGVSEAMLDEYDKPLYGVSLPRDYYGYETVDGYFEEGTTDLANPRNELNRLVERLDVRNPEETTGEDVPESVKRHLEYLGYA